MVVYENFEEFQAASREIFVREPRKTRYTCKYYSRKNEAPEVVLKVTDDVACIIFRTGNNNDMKYIDQFSQLVAIWSTLEIVDGESSLPPDLITAQKQISAAAAAAVGPDGSNITRPQQTRILGGKKSKRRKQQT